MNLKLLHTPEGVRDIYNDECEKKLKLQENLHDVMKLYGYRDIETPTFEYFDVFGSEVGTTPSKDLYKFFDREGNTLVLRPDLTPSIARAAAKYFSEDTDPIRLCYVGNTFINNSSYQGRLKETTQLGAELIGNHSADSDGEMIAMVIECLLKAGLKEFQISIGQVNFLESLLKEAGIEGGTEEKLKSLISNKNMFGVEELLSEWKMSKSLKELLNSLPKFYGGMDILEKVKTMTENQEAKQALSRLEEIYEILTIYGYEKYISFDLGMISKYMYYSGIIFRAYTFGTGDAVVKGGRYDHLLKHFGKEAPSVGFVVEINQLLNALGRQNLCALSGAEPVVLKYRAEERKEALEKARQLRNAGQRVALVPEE